MARPVSGKVLVRRPGSNEFVELDGSQSIPMGSTVDAKRGRVRITAETQQGKPPQRAEFYDGIFRITQTAHARRPQAGRGARLPVAAQR